MFIEPNSVREKKGWIEVICGSMFSGKTEELLRRLRRAQIANRKIEIFKPAIEARYSPNQVVSHDNASIQCSSVEQSEDILRRALDMDVIGIDEAQFLDNRLSFVAETLASRGVRVIIAGLDMDFEGNPFGPMPQLIAIADYITKVHAICVKCGDIAHFSFRTSANKNKILLGEKESYEARCRVCYYKGADA
jgi:thymidine kinase